MQAQMVSGVEQSLRCTHDTKKTEVFWFGCVGCYLTCSACRVYMYACIHLAEINTFFYAWSVMLCTCSRVKARSCRHDIFACVHTHTHTHTMCRFDVNGEKDATSLEQPWQVRTCTHFGHVRIQSTQRMETAQSTSLQQITNRWASGVSCTRHRFDATLTVNVGCSFKMFWPRCRHNSLLALRRSVTWRLCQLYSM